MYPQLLEMVGREREQDQARAIAANQLAKTLLTQRPALYRRLATWLADPIALAGRRLQTFRAASEIASE